MQSHTGDAIGIAVWPSVNLAMDGDVVIDDVTAGWLIPDEFNDLRWTSRPNRAPMACGVYNSQMFYDETLELTYVSNVKNMDEDVRVEVSNVYGFTYCDGDDSKTMFGEYIVADDEQDHEFGSLDTIDVGQDGDDNIGVESQEL